MITPQESYPKLAKVIGVDFLYLKREDLHPYGSHKGRSIPAMIDHYYQAGDRNFVISSSGNAALAAAQHINKLDSANLDIYVGNNIAPHKLEKLKKMSNERIRLLLKERPLQALNQAVQEGLRSLRQSTDNLALTGYQTLAQELSEIKNLSAVFIGCSSGTTAQALAEYFIDKKMSVQVHIVQTSSCHPIVDAFDNFSIPDEKSLADAIVDQTAIRKENVLKAVKQTGGRGWLATNQDIINAQEMVSRYADLNVSTNSALSIVGTMQAVYLGYEVGGTVACIICGD